MTLPWQEWAEDLGYPDRKSMLEGMLKEYKTIRNVSNRLGVEYQVVRRWITKEKIDFVIKEPGGANNIGPNYPVIQWAMENIPREKIKTMTIRDIIELSWEKPSKRLMGGMQSRLDYHHIKYKPGTMGRPTHGKYDFLKDISKEELERMTAREIATKSGDKYTQLRMIGLYAYLRRRSIKYKKIR